MPVHKIYWVLEPENEEYSAPLVISVTFFCFKVLCHEHVQKYWGIYMKIWRGIDPAIVSDVHDDFRLWHRLHCTIEIYSANENPFSKSRSGKYEDLLRK